MSEERKEKCGNCRFYIPEQLVTRDHRIKESIAVGWCSKRPRLHQKYNDRTYATNWCQYYEAKAMNKEEAKAAVDAMNEGRGRLNEQEKAFLDREVHMLSPDGLPPILAPLDENDPSNWINDELSGPIPHEQSRDANSGAKRELESLLKELAQFRSGATDQLVNASIAADTMSMMELRGMLRVATMFYQQIEARIKELNPHE